MKKIICILLCACFALSVSGCGGGQTDGLHATAQDDTAGNISTYLVDQSTSDNSLILEQGDAEIIKLGGASDNNNEKTKWTTSDSSVATVDDAGRVDAVGVGVADILVETDNGKISCNVKVIKDEPDEKTYSTAISANQSILNRNLKSQNSQMPYSIKINRKLDCVTVYTYDENMEYTVPVRAMISSCGANDGTITGDFSIYYKAEWNPLFGNVYGKYVSGFSGDYLFHSVPFLQSQSDTLEVDEYNKLGENASMGCVRMAVADTQWVFNNCEVGTPVTVYDDTTNPGPLGRPDSMHITDTSNGWDPTDDDEDNPYGSKAPVISGAKDLEIKKGESIDLLKDISAVDTCDNDITSKIITKGEVVANKAGTYKISYIATDAMHRTDRKDITVTVS